MSEPSPYCGRLDDHAAHEWVSSHAPTGVVVHTCPGAPVVEGGNPIRRSTPAEIAGDDAHEARYGRDRY